MQKFFTLVIIFNLFFISGFTQYTHYQNLVMEGGGIRGFAYVGAFEMLDSIGILKDVKRVGGSSVGALQAMLLATNYTIAEMKAVVNNIPLKKFNDGFILGGFHRIKERLGFYKGIAIAKWISTLIKIKRAMQI